jgi:K+-transporting ATPase A subunit
MTANGYLQLAFYILVLLALAKPLGAYMARVYEGRRLALERVFGWLERLIYRMCEVLYRARFPGHQAVSREGHRNHDGRGVST